MKHVIVVELDVTEKDRTQREELLRDIFGQLHLFGFITNAQLITVDREIYTEKAE